LHLKCYDIKDAKWSAKHWIVYAATLTVAILSTVHLLTNIVIKRSNNKIASKFTQFAMD